MSLARRISEHPWLSLTVSAATIISTAIAVSNWVMPAHRDSRPEIDAPKEDAAPAAANDLVGLWQLQPPGPAGWIVEYKPDGTYVFTMPNAEIHGVYEAKDGKFSSRAPSYDSEDEGDYRLIDTRTLEMDGRQGVSVWKRLN
ncbi:MAG: hypothetical protein R3B98_10375 [Hyphomonas sp.]